MSAEAPHAGPLHDAYSARVAGGEIEDDAGQRRVVHFLTDAVGRMLDGVEQQRASSGPDHWVLPKASDDGVRAVKSDHQKAAEFTARMAADNARRAKQQADKIKLARGQTPDAVAPACKTISLDDDIKPKTENPSPAAAASVASACKTISFGDEKSPPPAAAASVAPACKTISFGDDAEPKGAFKADAAKESADVADSKPQVTTTTEAEVAEKPKPRKSSVYMFGSVGTGKTMLLDLLHSQSQEVGLRVQRKHFYEFMLDFHVRIHEMDQDRPVERIANQIADDIDVLCFDEFQITDIQDAAIIPRIFEVLFLRGVLVVVTSNTAPGLLYSGGLNRHVHIPEFVSLISSHCNILRLGKKLGEGDETDYRRRAELAEARADGTVAAVSFLSGPGAVASLKACWLASAGPDQAPCELKLPMGRKLDIAQAAGDACFFEFHDLCGGDRGEADFYALAENFRTVLVAGIPKFSSLGDYDEVRRFVKLLDVLYDRKVRIVVAAVGELEQLFDGIREDISDGDINALAWRTVQYSADGKAGMNASAVGTLYEGVRATERAESRLREMRTKRYWEECGRHADGSDSTSKKIDQWLQAR